MDNVFLQGYERARAAGLSDEKILADLSRNPVYGPMIQQAQAAGLSGGAIVSGLKTGALEQMANPKLEERTRFEAFGRGMEDVASGITSLAPTAIGDQYTQESSDRAKVYDKANKNVGFDGGRVVGQVLPLLALSRFAPGAGAPTTKRLAGNAAVGAVGGFIPREDSLGQRITNAAFGGIFGAAGPEAVRLGSGLVSKAVRYVKGKTADIAGAVDNALGAAGDDIAQLGEDAVAKTRAYLEQLATQQIKATGKLDQQALARAAKISAVSPELRPTLGQITRDPAIYSAEKNLAKSGTDAGNLVNKRFQEQEAVLRDTSKQMVEKTGGQQLTDYAYGTKAGGVLRTKWKQMQDEVSAAYQAAEKQFGDVPVQMDGLVKGIADKAFTEGQETAEGRMATIALNKLKSYGLFDESGNLKEGANLTIGQLRDLRQSLNSIDSLTGATPDQAIRAKMGVINAIDDAVGGSEVGDVFKPARDAARARFGEFADRTMSRIKTDQVPDEKLFDLATGRNVDTARDYAKALTTGTPEQIPMGEEVMRDTQRKLMAQILSKAARGPQGEEQFSPSSLRNALNPDLNGYQPEVIDALLTPQQAGGLRQFSETLDYLRADPAFNSINHSGSGALVSGLMQGGENALVGRLAGLSEAGGGVISGAVRGVIGSAKEREQALLAKALLEGNPAAIPGIGEQATMDMLTPNSKAQKWLIQALLGAPGAAATTSVTGNR